MPSSIVKSSRTVSEDTLAGRVNKKQKKSSDVVDTTHKPKTTQSKSVKSVDVTAIEQRRGVVQTRVLKLESKLAKDRALLAKYTSQLHSPDVAGDCKKGNYSDEDERCTETD